MFVKALSHGSVTDSFVGLEITFKGSLSEFALQGALFKAFHGRCELPHILSHIKKNTLSKSCIKSL